MTFHVGQKVVCVDDQPIFTDEHPYRRGISLPLKIGQIYTISGTAMTPKGSIGIYLAEVKSPYPPFSDGRERTWYPPRFRPLTETKSSQSFTTGAPKDSERWDNRRKVRERAQ